MHQQMTERGDAAVPTRQALQYGRQGFGQVLGNQARAKPPTCITMQPGGRRGRL